MELRHLRYFVAVASEENVSRAALKLHVSQPGLSRQIHDLEDEIGFQLFERSAKSLRLTDAGKTLLTEARAVLQHAEDAVKKARLAAGAMTGELHVGYAPSLTIRILPQALRTFQATLPKVRVMLRDLSTDEMLNQLRTNKIQVALMVQPCDNMLRGLEFKELARYPICVAVPPGHPIAKLKSVKLSQIAHEPLIAYNRDEYPEYHLTLDKIYAETKQRPQIAEEHDGVTSVVAAVEAGHGFAFLPSCVACMVGPRLRLVPLKSTIPPVPVAAVWVTENATDITKQFVQAAAAAEPYVDESTLKGKPPTNEVPALV
jgi:DNA-binding transcriptional LysR family regulator